MLFINTLKYLTSYYKVNISISSLVDGLQEDEISTFQIKHMEKSVKKLGLELEVSKFKGLKNFKDEYLPFIAKVNEEKVFFVHKLNENHIFITVISADSFEEKKVDRNTFEKHILTKDIILLKKSFSNIRDINNKKHDAKRWFVNIIKNNTKIYIQVLFAAFFINVFILASPLFVMNVYDRVVPNNATDTLIVLAIGIILIYAFDMILKVFRSWLIGVAGKKADAQISRLIFNKLLNLRLDSKPEYSGTFANNLLGFESLREFFTASTIALIIDLPFILLFIFVIYYIGGAMAIVPIITFTIGMIIALLSQIPQRRYIKESFEHDQYKQGLLLETIVGLETVKSTGLQGRMRYFWEKSINVLVHVNEKSHFLNSSINYLLAFINNLSSVGIIAIGVFGVKNGEITMGAIIAASLLNGRINAPVTQIVSLSVRLERSLLSLNVLNSFMNMPVEKENNKVYLNRPNMAGKITFKNVSFKYKEEENYVINNLNLNIAPGEKVAIIGRIGSGKSTLAKLMANLYKTTEGSVILDDSNISQIEPSDIRSSLGYMPQDNYLFMGTVHDNIKSGCSFIDDEKIIKAAKLSTVDSFTSRHEKGFDLFIGERGDGLSGGEKQAVSLARAVVHEPRLLILDEPTSQMDSLHEKIIIQNLTEFSKDKTLVLITHKFSLLPLVNRIIIIDNGSIIEDGPKDFVMKKLQDGKVLVHE